MIDRIAYLFGQTAWPMEMQAPGSAFHLLLSLAGIACAVSAAMFLAGRKNLRPENVLFSCGLLLAFFELYKQGFLYFVVNGRCYNWWYFPFQLCSIPMYLCLAYPFVARPHTSSGKHGVFNTRGSGAAAPILATFLQDFGLLGGLYGPGLSGRFPLSLLDFNPPWFFLAFSPDLHRRLLRAERTLRLWRNGICPLSSSLFFLLSGCHLH